MQPSDLVLVLAADLVAPDQPAYPLDRIRMQKAVFLLTHASHQGWSEMFDYSPYNWGPYSSQLTDTVHGLRQAGELVEADFPGSQYGTYRTSPSGEARAHESWAELTEQERTFIRRVRAYVSAKSFQQLLREVYAAFPTYATASRFRG